MFFQARSKGVGLSDKANLLCLSMSGRKTTQRRHSWSTAGESTWGCCFLVQNKSTCPTCSSGSFPGPWHSRHLPLSPQAGSCWLSLTGLRWGWQTPRPWPGCSRTGQSPGGCSAAPSWPWSYRCCALGDKGGWELVSAGSPGPLHNTEIENAPPCSCICLCSQILSTLRAFCSVLSGMRSMCSSRYTRPYSGQWSK